ncbi:MAG: hypothetical protein ACRBK7_18900 [Acidimicrobiales bacterium]
MIVLAISTGWYIGWGIGLVVVLLVVALLLLMIRGASRAAVKVQAIIDALAHSERNTAALWDVHTTNKTIGRITRSATDAREYLASKASS